MQPLRRICSFSFSTCLAPFFRPLLSPLALTLLRFRPRLRFLSRFVFISSWCSIKCSLVLSAVLLLSLKNSSSLSSNCLLTHFKTRFYPLSLLFRLPFLPFSSPNKNFFCSLRPSFALGVDCFVQFLQRPCEAEKSHLGQHFSSWVRPLPLLRLALVRPLLTPLKQREQRGQNKSTALNDKERCF